ncbi:MAG: acyl-CoA synthetase FdrA [Candidatus Hodarchaeales archaeon]
MSVIKTHLIKQQYRDSVQLMRAASSLSKLEGVELASILMGTDKNKPLLKEVDLLTDEAIKATSNDIIISIKATSEEAATKAIDFAVDYLTKEASFSADSTFEAQSLRGALSLIPDANLAIISVPGEYAARETRIALENNLNVLLFSDNVPIEDEIKLKKEAHSRNLLVMGPDCGTAMIKGVGLAFCNVVNSGSIGIVAASGTGTQEVMVLCHHMNLGVTHAIGTGSNDVKDKVGGITMIDGLRALDRDPSIELIIIVSKPPQQKTMDKVLKVVKECSKPVIINFLGQKPGFFDTSQTITVETLEEAAYSAAHFFAHKELKRPVINFDDPSKIKDIISSETSNLNNKQRYIRGLYAGGTFTFEAAMIISSMLPEEETLWTNVSLKGTKLIENPKQSKEHTLIDLGADEFTVGKPHPMIDQTERTNRFLEEIKDPEVAVILLDFVLGYGSHPDPVNDMMEAFNKWKKLERRVPIVVHVCGTELDPQDYDSSIQTLRDLGIHVMPSNAQAARLAAHIATRKLID